MDNKIEQLKVKTRLKTYIIEIWHFNERQGGYIIARKSQDTTMIFIIIISIKKT